MDTAALGLWDTEDQAASPTQKGGMDPRNSRLAPWIALFHLASTELRPEAATAQRHREAIALAK
jgi:hypothetical protein